MIGIIDSGIGGKGIEKEIKKLLPKVKVIYFADTRNFPYGTKKIDELNIIIAENVRYLISCGATIIVLACNSGSVTSLEYLRKNFNIPIIGVVPAIKTASEITKTKKIAIFATPITTKSKIQEELIKEYCKDCRIYKISFKDLAGLIERGETEEYTSEVYAVWSRYKNKNIDVIVLGCTHYTLIKNEIQEIVGKNVKIIDSNKAVAEQVKKVYDNINK